MAIDKVRLEEIQARFDALQAEAKSITDQVDRYRVRLIEIQTEISGLLNELHPHVVQ